MRSLLGRFHRPFARSAEEQLLLLNNLGDGSTLSLDFTTGVLDPRLTLTRSTTGTYINSSGYVTSAAIDTPRFDHDPTAIGTPRGLLIEGSASNLLNNSSDFSTGGWGGSGYTYSTGATSPDGVNSAQRLTVASGASQTCNRQQPGTVNATSCTFSIWWKNGNHTTSTNTALRTIAVRNNTSATILLSFHFNPTTLAITYITGSSGASVVAYPNGWYRITANVTTGITSGNTIGCYFGGIGSTVSGEAGTYCDWWGAQLETGSGASSYISTGASTGSRAADSCVMTGTNFSSWFAGATEGVLYAETEQPRKTASPSADHAIVGTRYTSGQGLWIYASANLRNPSAYIWPSGGGQFAGGIGTSIPTSNKQAVRWFDGNDITNFGNGTQGTTNTAGTGTMVPTMLTIGANSTSGTAAGLEWFNGCIRRVKFWPTALPNTTIQALTT